MRGRLNSHARSVRQHIKCRVGPHWTSGGAPSLTDHFFWPSLRELAQSDPDSLGRVGKSTGKVRWMDVSELSDVELYAKRESKSRKYNSSCKHVLSEGVSISTHSCLISMEKCAIIPCGEERRIL